MPRTKKAAAAEEAAAKNETLEAAAPAETAAPVAEEAPKQAAKKPRAKKADAPAEEKPARTKKAAKLTTKVVVELADRSATPDELIERAKTDWANKGNAVDDIKELAVYVNAAEGTVYYVVNDDYLSGSFDF